MIYSIKGPEMSNRPSISGPRISTLVIKTNLNFFQKMLLLDFMTAVT